MSLYLSRDLLLSAVTNFKLLANGEEIKQGVTQDVSAIRHCLALARLLNKNSLSSVKLKHKTDPYLDDFITYVGDIVKLDQNGNYTTNFINDIKQKSDFGVNSNLLSAGVATHSSQSVQNYPKKANKGLIVIDDYEFSLADDYLDKLKGTYDFSRVGFSFLIWLNRFNEFDEKEREPKAFFDKLVEYVKGEYSSELADLISYSNSDDFIEYSKHLSSLLSEHEVELKSLFAVKPQINENTLKESTSSTVLSKPFLLLAGISGTGKTRFVREQAKMTGSLSDTYCLTSVRPDWHEPSDILGYISRLGDGAEYVTTEVLQFIAKAWRAIIDADLELQVIDDRLMVSGDQAQLSSVLPYWLCLDEMNLAPVEQYFADYLSVLETREWCWDDEQFYYCCDPLLKSAIIDQLADRDTLRNALGFMDSRYDETWQLFCEHGMSLPFNLIVAGTVNMDETTHGFSRKVIDRALSFDFGEFFPNDFDHFFAPIVQHKALSYPLYSQATINKLPDIDSSGNRSIGFLQAVNSVLDNSPFKLAFRALNELLLAVISSEPIDEPQLQAVWDDFLMHKVLPRIEGDYDKLALIDKTANPSSNEQSVLKKLAEVLEQQLAGIWHETVGSAKARPDLYRQYLRAEEDDKVLRIACRSKAKLTWMQQRLERSGFTSFWP